MFRNLLIIFLTLVPLSGQCEDDYEKCERLYGVSSPLLLERLVKVASEGDEEAQYCLAVVYHDGHDGTRDPTKAVEWYTRAAQKGHVEAQYWLCLMHRDGLGTEVNTLESLYWCKRAVKKNHPGALYALGQWYFDGPNRNEGHSYVNAYIWFSRALDAGETGARQMLELLENRMTDLQILEAKKLSQRDN